MRTIELRISEHDYTLILGALRESSAAIEAWELQTRVGGTSAELTALSLKIRSQGDEQRVEE